MRRLPFLWEIRVTGEIAFGGPIVSSSRVIEPLARRLSNGAVVWGTIWEMTYDASRWGVDLSTLQWSVHPAFVVDRIVRAVQLGRGTLERFETPPLGDDDDWVELGYSEDGWEEV